MDHPTKKMQKSASFFFDAIVISCQCKFRNRPKKKLTNNMCVWLHGLYRRSGRSGGPCLLAIIECANKRQEVLVRATFEFVKGRHECHVDSSLRK
jgi:hypothetical protein